MNLQKFHTDLRSMADKAMHGSGTRLLIITDGVQLKIERNDKGSGNVKCHLFVISDPQFIILDTQLESVHN